MIPPSMMGPGGPPPPSISLPGMGNEEPPKGDDDSGKDVSTLVREALAKIRVAAEKEPDDEDQAKLEKLGTLAAQFLADAQKLTDSAMGAGPGVKLVRKAAGQSGPGY